MTSKYLRFTSLCLGIQKNILTFAPSNLGTSLFVIQEHY